MSVIEAPPNLAIPPDAFYKAFKDKPQDYLDSSSTISQQPVIDRILPITEAQEILGKQGPKVIFPSEGTIVFTSQIRKIRALEASFGIEANQRLAHSPAIDRSRIERVGQSEDKPKVREGVIDDAKKHLYERAKADKSTILYYQDESGRIYNNNFPEESSDVIWQRGLEYSKAKNSVDFEREVAEFEGWKEVMGVLFNPDATIGSKAIIISGPGQEKGTIFTDNFVDIYTRTIYKSSGKIVVIQTRFASGSDYEEYIRLALSLDSNYFRAGKPEKDREGIYFKRYPIYLNTESYNAEDDNQIFKENFKAQKGTISEERIRNFINECMPFLEHYADQICADFFDTEKVKESFHAFINFFDKFRKGAVEIGKNAVNGIFNFAKETLNTFKSITDKIVFYGRQKVEEIMVGCGLSGGFSLGSAVRGIKGIFSKGIGIIKSIGSFLGISSKDKDFCNNCPVCGEAINCIVRGGESCPSCGAVKRCG